MNRLTPNGRFALVVALAVIAVDQLTKAWVLGPLHLALYESRPVIPPVFNLTLVHNEGVSFGLLKANADLARWGLVLFSLAVAGALGWWAQGAQRRLSALAIGLVMGGALGNAIDRARLGHVTDFLDFSGLHFPWVFNGADTAINIGVAILLLEGLFGPAQPAAAKKA
jgi:signal peptidase II